MSIYLSIFSHCIVIVCVADTICVTSKLKQCEYWKNFTNALFVFFIEEIIFVTMKMFWNLQSNSRWKKITRQFCVCSMLSSTQDGAPHPGLAAHHGAALLLRPLQGDQTLGAFPHRVPHQVSATYHTALSWLSNTPSAATTRVWRRTRCTTTSTRCVSTLSRYLYLHIYNIYISTISTYLQYIHIYTVTVCSPAQSGSH